MSLPIILRPEAEADLLDARDWYDRQQPGLGDKFTARASALLELVAAMPESFAVIGRDVRACRVDQFPYVVYYRVLADRVEILALLHGSRDPSTWRSRA